MSHEPHIMEEAESMLDVYIYDYLVKRKLNASSKTFQAEAHVPPNAVAIDAPRGFLFEWWTIFWDTFIARYKRHDPVRNDPLNDYVMKQRFGDNVGPGLNPINLVNPPPIRHHKQVSVPTREMPRSMSPLGSSGVAGSNGSLTGVHGIGSSEQVNSLPLKGWPLMALDQLHPALLQQQRSPMQSTQLSFQHQLQQHLLHQARQRLASSSADSREVQACSNQNMSIEKAGQSRTVDLKDTNDGSKNQMRRKRNQPSSSSGPASSSRTPNTVGSSPSSGPSTPSTHTTGDIVTLPSLQQNDCTSKPSYMTSVANQLVHTDHVDDGSLDDNIKSLLSHTDAVTDVDIGKGFTFSEIGTIVASSSDCCHLSSDGKLLASAGHNNKATLWWTDSRKLKDILHEHTKAITDIRFSPIMPRVATASLDKTVRVWDLEYPFSLQQFIHPSSVTSLDFHPNRNCLLCSSDSTGIRFWSIENGSSARMTETGAKQVRFQPRLGRYLAAVVADGVSLMDTETGQTSQQLLKGHTSKVQSISWDFSGEHLASVSEDLVRVWKIRSGGERDCIHELRVTGKKFRCSVFHPHYPLLIIGCSESLELWNMAENKMMTSLEEPIAALAIAETTGLVATSAGRDNIVKLWK